MTGDYGEKQFLPLSEAEAPDGAKVFINGRWVGTIRQKYAVGVQTHLRAMRAEQRLNPETGICLSAQQDELILACDEGRVMRPLLVISGEINQ